MHLGLAKNTPTRRTRTKRPPPGAPWSRYPDSADCITPTPWQLKALTPHTESSLAREDLHVWTLRVEVLTAALGFDNHRPSESEIHT